MKGLTFAVAICVFLAADARATTFVNRPLGEVVKEAAFVVRGRAGESYSDWDKSGRKSLYTYTELTVTDVLKGALKAPRIKLRQPGGQKDGTEMNVPGTAHFLADEDVVVLLGPKNEEDDSYDVPGFTTGKYNIVAGENGEPYLSNSLGGGAMYDPAKDARAQSYNAKVPLEVFRRIAQGEDVPEGAHRQFERSNKPAPKGAFESGHAQHFQEKSQDKAQDKPPAQPQEAERVPDAVIETPKRNIWVPISFAIIALIGVVALVLLTRSSGKGGPADS